MKLIYILPLLFFACTSKEEAPKNETRSSISDKVLMEYKRGMEVEENSIIMQERWNETLVRPDVSSIVDFKYLTEDLFQTWTFAIGGLADSSFSIDKDAFRPSGQTFMYTINQDSIRIFNDSDQGDGVDRGVINKLSKDSLIIDFSDGGIDKYIHFRK